MAVMRKTKARAAALDVPQNDADANALLAQYGEAFNVVARLRSDMNDRLAAVKAKFETEAAPWQAQMQDIFSALNAYAGANRDRLTEKGKSKTVDMAAGAMGWRLNPPSVRLKRGHSWDRSSSG
jgi:phage host-nuclease inhibitor protein Gam